MWFVYIIKCHDDSFYVGATSNIERRFKEHKNSKGGRYTGLHKAEELLYSESFLTKAEALRRERQLKGWMHKKKENLISLKIK